jgi:hypothetical protein
MSADDVTSILREKELHVFDARENGDGIVGRSKEYRSGPILKVLIVTCVFDDNQRLLAVEFEQGLIGP